MYENRLNIIPTEKIDVTENKRYPRIVWKPSIFKRFTKNKFIVIGTNDIPMISSTVHNLEENSKKCSPAAGIKILSDKLIINAKPMGTGKHLKTKDIWFKYNCNNSVAEINGIFLYLKMATEANDIKAIMIKEKRQ